jgi:hypothetical protein
MRIHALRCRLLPVYKPVQGIVDAGDSFFVGFPVVVHQVALRIKCGKIAINVFSVPDAWLPNA